MKFVFLLILCLSFAACAGDEKAFNSNVPQPANKNAVIINNTPPPTNTNKPPTNGANPNTKTINSGEKFTLKGGETGKLKDGGLELKIVTVGSMSLPVPSQNAQPAGAVPFCRVEATLNGKTEGEQIFNQAGKNEFIFEGYKIRVQEIVPTGNISCTFIVTKN